MTGRTRVACAAVAMAALVQGAGALAGGIAAAAGPYRIEVHTEPAVIAVGRSRLSIRVTDAGGKPVAGAEVRALVKMPAMDMGEREAAAAPVAGSPGTYAAPAVFAMEGAYQAAITVSGAAGPGRAAVDLATGQDTSGGGRSPLTGAFPWLLAGAAVLVVAHRIRRSGQRVELRAIFNRRSVPALLMLAVIGAASSYAVGHWRRPGAMTPIEAQAMEMDTPAPLGVAPVELARVDRGVVSAAMRYTGQVAAYSEEDVAARVPGWLNWMPLYVGDRVGAGQVVARLDRTQVDPQMAERSAGVDMAAQGVAVARSEYHQASHAVHQAVGEEATRRGAIAEAQANVEAARAERSAADAMLAEARSKVADAQAQVRAAQSDQQYWTQEIARERALFDRGAVSREELQRETAQADAAEARVRQAQAAAAGADAAVRAAQAGVRRADAMVSGAGSRVDAAKAELQTHSAHVRTSEAEVETAKARIAQANAGVRQARGALASASALRSFTEVRSRIGGVVTQRSAAPGAYVGSGQAVLRIAQIDRVRVQANVPEDAIGRVRPGVRVVVTGPGGAAPIEARVTSVSPSVDPVARMGVVEAVVANPGGRLLPGQSVTLDIEAGGAVRGLRVPVRALRSHTPPGSGVTATASETTAWKAVAEGGQTTVTRVAVRTGASGGGYAAVLDGLVDGDRVVVAGDGDLREGDTVAAAASAAPAAAPDGSVAASIEVSERGFEPAEVSASAGQVVRLTFLRRTEKGCGQEVVVPAFGIRRALPLNVPVTVEFRAPRGGVAFTCGMNMLRGKVVVR